MGLWLWVSARSGGLRAWVHGGSGGPLERKCEEKGRTESAKGRLWEHFGIFLAPFWETRAETESTGPKRAFRRFSEVPSTTKSTVFFRCWLSWGPSGKVSGAFRKLFRAILGSMFGTIERGKHFSEVGNRRKSDAKAAENATSLGRGRWSSLSGLRGRLGTSKGSSQELRYTLTHRVVP